MNDSIITDTATLTPDSDDPIVTSGLFTPGPRTTPVTAQDLRALKHADSIVFRLYQGQATVEAYLRENSPANTSGFEQKRVIDAGGPRITDYQREHNYVPEGEWHRYSGFAFESTYSDLMRTLVSRIRTGCTLALDWTRNGYANDITRQAGLVVDHLKLQITPHGKDGSAGKPELYLVRVQVGLDNSARMVKIDWNGA